MPGYALPVLESHGFDLGGAIAAVKDGSLDKQRFVREAVLLSGLRAAARGEDARGTEAVNISSTSYPFWTACEEVAAGKVRDIPTGKMTAEAVGGAWQRFTAGTMETPANQGGGNGSREDRAPVASAVRPAADGTAAQPVTDSVMASLEAAFTAAQGGEVPTSPAEVYTKLWEVLPEPVKVSHTSGVLTAALTDVSKNRKDDFAAIIAGLPVETRDVLMAQVAARTPDAITANVQHAVSTVYRLNKVLGYLGTSAGSGWAEGVDRIIRSESADKPLAWTPTDEDRAKAARIHVLAMFRALYDALTLERESAAKAAAAAQNAPPAVGGLEPVAWAEISPLLTREARPGIKMLWDSQTPEVQHRLMVTAREEAAKRAAAEEAEDAANGAEPTAEVAPEPAAEVPTEGEVKPAGRSRKS